MTESASPPAAAAAADTALASPLSGPSEQSLHRTARLLAVVLTVVCTLSFIAGRSYIADTVSIFHVMGVALIGMSGSGVGALTSLLARYAAGFELDDGTRVPATAEGELYNRRIGFCMLMRPVLGLLVAPLLVAGVALFFKAHEDFKGSADAVTIVAFIGGLYAKSVLEAAKNAFKVVFRA
jgi:type IV secretory pathway VirB2 component (pilin)